MGQTNPHGVEVFETAFECKDCGAIFHISREQQESLKARHLELPKRCVECRRKRHSRRKSNPRYNAVNQAEGHDTTQKTWDVGDFERVMCRAKEEIKRWR